MEAYRYLAQVYDDMMHDVDYTSWAKYLHKILQSAEVKRVLDIACGTGSITSALYRLGYDITASDISPSMLTIAKENAMRRGEQIRFVRQDIREITVGNPVDAIVCACDGVNYIRTVDIKRFAASAFRALRNGGLLLFDISSAQKLENVMNGEVYFDESDDAACIWQNTYDKAIHGLIMDVTVFVRTEGEFFVRHEEQHIQFAHTAAQITHEMYHAGFALAEAFAFMTSKPPKEHAERIQFVCRKPI